jgi:formate hydrogenlyase subunit 6/NADH:ubiquinone oxidoreductase subunit I
MCRSCRRVCPAEMITVRESGVQLEYAAVIVYEPA